MEQPHKYPYKLSVIIVNYNVEFFLEQCLNSVKKALKNVSGEVFIVDNNSIDNSVEMVKNRFPEYILIDNKENLGFSKANNQAIRISQGEYVLLLNPDTVVEEDTFEKVVAFMDEHPDAGGLGVRMLDGKGNFLPESKRGLPTPSVAFYKIFGLSKLFPKSKKFGQYHLGYLSEFETNECEILSGAFMLMRKEALDKVGLLDEAFFMYGEDIDLSYRIIKGGYKNYYFPVTRIIHYKGESTKKSSVNYVFVFYRAMVIFAEKHFSNKNAKLFSTMINFAIYLRASLAILARFVKRAFLPAVDITLLTAGLFLLTHQWSKDNIEFPQDIIKFAIPIYVLTWLISIFYSGGYDRPIQLKKSVYGTLIGTIIILTVYALLPKVYQFSRLFILEGALLTMCYFLFSRLFLHFGVGKEFKLKGTVSKRFLIIGDKTEVQRVTDVLKNSVPQIDAILLANVGKEKEDWSVGTIQQLDQITHIHKINEIIFCAKNTTASDIIDWMTKIDSQSIDFKIAQPESVYLIGSNSIDTAGDLYVLNINTISTKSNLRLKRTLDTIVGLIGILFLPIFIWFYRNKLQFVRNMFALITGKKSVVGYIPSVSQNELPKIKPSILQHTSTKENYNQDNIDRLNLIYVRDYTLQWDIKALFKDWLQLDSGN